MKRKKIVVALGHKALGTTLPEQKAAVKRSAKVIADLVAAGADVVITHSPDVCLLRYERRLHRLRPAERHPC